VGDLIFYYNFRFFQKAFELEKLLLEIFKPREGKIFFFSFFADLNKGSLKE